MDYLAAAKKFMIDAHEESEKDIEYAQVAASIATAYAAIAQAEQLKRIADALEKTSAIEYVLRDK